MVIGTLIVLMEQAIVLAIQIGVVMTALNLWQTNVQDMEPGIIVVVLLAEVIALVIVDMQEQIVLKH